jgi:membrane associated rhomboid family serine protease
MPKAFFRLILSFGQMHEAFFRLFTILFLHVTILHAVRFCALPVRAFISIEKKTGKPALLPVGHSFPVYESPTGITDERHTFFY